MGREIRRVAANWEHPRRKCHHSPWAGGCGEAKRHGGMCYQPMRDEDFDTALEEWYSGYHLWKKGEHPEQDEYSYFDYAGNPPEHEYYRPKWEAADWFQMYETVSEGTPLTPPFATKAELVDYLVENGDFWDQIEGRGGWKRENAERFAEVAWAPSTIFRVVDGKNEMKEPRDGA